MLSFVIQRIPIISHAVIVWIAIAGPTACPLLFNSLLLFVHLLLLTTNLQALWGAYSAWRGVQRTSLIDWFSYWSTEAQKQRTLVSAEAAGTHLTFDKIEHVIIIPIYKEAYEVLQETLDILCSHARCTTSYRVCLGLEERDSGSRNLARRILNQYAGHFCELTFSSHPNGIHGEVAGKSSNVNWAARHMAARSEQTAHERQIITVMDSDTALAQDYFDCITALYCLASAEVRQRMMFAVPIIFDRNANKVPMFVNFVDVCWSIAGLSSIYPTSACKIPTSAYGLSMQLAIAVDFWDSGPEAVGEDMHMAIKCFLCTGGTVHVETVYSPASQLNVIGHREGGLRGYYSALYARYQQAVRHMWGSLDFGYATRRILIGDTGRMYVPDISENEKSYSIVSSHSPTTARSRSQRMAFPLLLIGGVFAQALRAISSVRSNPVRLLYRLVTEHVRIDRTLKYINLMIRLFQAHILIAWGFIVLSFIQLVPLTLSLTTRLLFLCGKHNLSVVPYACSTQTITWATKLNLSLQDSVAHLAVPQQGEWTVMAVILLLCQIIRQLSLPMSIAAYFFHAKYHQVGAVDRWSTDAKANRLGLRPAARAVRPLPWAMLEVVAFPASFVYGVIPTLHAQVLHLFTNQMTVTSSMKCNKSRSRSDTFSAGEKIESAM